MPEKGPPPEKVDISAIEVVEPTVLHKTSAEKADELLREIQNEVYQEALSVVSDQLAFKEIDPRATEPPEEWVRAMGPKKALEKFRVVQAAWMSSSDAPVALRHATQLVLGILKAKATEKAGAKNLNIGTMVVLPRSGGPAPEFPRIEVEE